jgi:1-acyl-sn-glycerol-3-phosphate acyltransferase
VNYRILHTYCLLIIRFFIKSIHTTGLEKMPKNGPVIMAGTHPNSFIDGMIISLMFHRPVWSLSRGDAFKNDWARRFMTSIKLMPIYRMSEGRENLSKNGSTFDKVQGLLKKDQQILVFVEGLCTNQTKLLPLKKGMGRMVQSAWAEGIDTPVFPVALTYSNFDKIEKTANIHFGDAILPSDFEEKSGGVFLHDFNEVVKEKLQGLLSWDFKPGSFFDNPIYYIGWVVNFPWYLLTRFIAKRLTKGTVHTDSVYFAFLIFTLPIYWGILIAILT